MRVYLSLLMLASIFLLSACKKSKSFNVKFEITSTAAVLAPFPTIVTKTGFASSENHTDFTAGTSWAKDVVLDTEYRPVLLSLNAQNVIIAAPGSVTTSIYVNGTRQATNRVATTVISGQNVASTSPVSYTVEK